MTFIIQAITKLKMTATPTELYTTLPIAFALPVFTRYATTAATMIRASKPSLKMIVSAQINSVQGELEPLVFSSAAAS